MRVIEKRGRRVGGRRLVEVEFSFVVMRSERGRWTGKLFFYFYFCLFVCLCVWVSMWVCVCVFYYFV